MYVLTELVVAEVTHTILCTCRNTECDYSSAYVSLFTEDDKLVGNGQVCMLSFTK